MKEKILKMLKSEDGFVSGQRMCEELNVSRTAVWKYINKLQEEGYDIESVRNRGYHLREIPDVITEAEIKSRLETKWLGHEIYYFDEIDSTNEFLKKMDSSDGEAHHGAIAIADRQTAGKGRLGRHWQTPKGESIAISYRLKPRVKPSDASMLTIIAALATAKAVTEATGLETEIKWPNDIVVNKKKICGILTEMSADMDQIHYVVAGIGVNVNMTSFTEDIVNTATSLRIEKGEIVKRADVIVEMLKYFEYYFEKFEDTADLSLVVEDYNAMLVNRGRQVKIIDGENGYEATAICMNERGELEIEKPDGSRELIRSGEVSVRGLYGYV